MLLPFLLAFQQGTAILQGPAPVQATTPPSRDTVGYWQQRANYRITARLDERAQRIQASGDLTYVNHSPDTLRELYLHQYLNAFRPGSKWSQRDAREGRVRFQHLRDPDHGYERFTAAPLVDGVAVTPEYPGAPDSTVVRLALPRALLPGDSVVVRMQWDARPSTLARRQGRRGRQWDLAHWYPKPAVYDRGGWEPNALQAAGEFYSEFGDYDVTLQLADDQVLGATGVVVQGDPGWERARRHGIVLRQPGAYGDLPAANAAPTPDGTGEKVVRIVARDVHTFAWSVSPDYRYEGGGYLRARNPLAGTLDRIRTWDTVAVHVLYRPGDERDWGNGQAVQRTVNAIAWLERIYGPYAYPQMTNLHRIDGGGTEFPMMMMNGSASQGLILHEGGHIYSYGILANNEWQSGWMDEGLTSYQTSWAQGLTRIEEARGGAGVALPVRVAGPTPQRGYLGRAVRPITGPDADLALWRMDLLKQSEPIGTRADRFRDFGTYNNMIYGRAEVMYGALRDAIGDTAFSAFLRDYYARWALRHVDEVAMRASAERAAGRDLGWFFRQWVHDVGLLDYALENVRVSRVEGGGWQTTAQVRRVGPYRHPMPVGVRTADGWTFERSEATLDETDIDIRTAGEPLEVRLDPLRTTEDWYAPNDGGRDADPIDVVDWPLLDQAHAERSVRAWLPMAWTGTPGGLALGARMRTNYRGLVNRGDAGLAFYLARVADCSRTPFGNTICRRPGLGATFQRPQVWLSLTNPRLGGRPRMGVSAGYWRLDGLTKLELRRTDDRSSFTFSRGPRVTTSLYARLTVPNDERFIDPARWSRLSVFDAGVSYEWRAPAPSASSAPAWRPLLRIEGYGGASEETGLRPALQDRLFGVVQGEAAATRPWARGSMQSAVRLWAGWAGEQTPIERQLMAGMRNPTETFANHFVRPREGLLSHPDVPFLVPGGAGLRGYDARLALGRAAAANVEQAFRIRTLGRGRPVLYGTAFADAAIPLQSRTGDDALADAGFGLALRGPLFDRDVRLRLDLPLWVRQPGLAVGRQAVGDAVGVRIAFAASDLW